MFWSRTKWITSPRQQRKDDLWNNPTVLTVSVLESTDDPDSCNALNVEATGHVNVWLTTSTTLSNIFKKKKEHGAIEL